MCPSPIPTTWRLRLLSPLRYAHQVLVSAYTSLTHRSCDHRLEAVSLSFADLSEIVIHGPTSTTRQLRRRRRKANSEPLRRQKEVYSEPTIPDSPTSTTRQLRPRKANSEPLRRQKEVYSEPIIHNGPTSTTRQLHRRKEERWFGLQENLPGIVKDKNFEWLSHLGGAQRIAEYHLKIDTNVGIRDEADALEKRAMFGKNTYNFNLTSRPAKGFFECALEPLKDFSNILLLSCATLSLVFQIEEEGPGHRQYDSVIIFLTPVVIYIVIRAIVNWHRAKKEQKLSNSKANIPVEAVRDGSPTLIPIADVVVGDIVILKTGDMVPADGLLLTDDPLQVEGISDLESRIDRERNPFLFSQTNVIDGSGRMLVTSVGVKTRHGEMMSFLTHDPNVKTPIQAQINKVNSLVEISALVLTVITIVVLFLRFKLRHKVDNENGLPDVHPDKTIVTKLLKSIERTFVKQICKVRIFTSSLMLVVMQASFPLSLTLSLYRTKRMMFHKAEVHDLTACETIGSATVIILTDTFERSVLKVAKFYIGEEVIDEEGLARLPYIHELLLEGVGLNTISDPECPTNIIEKTLISWAEMKLGLNMEELKGSHTILPSIESNYERKLQQCGALIKKNGVDGSVCSHWKGAAATILEMCSLYIDIDGRAKVIIDNKRIVLRKVIEDMEANGYLTIAFACKQHTHKEEILYEGDGNHDDDPRNDDDDSDGGNGADDDTLKLEEKGLILLGLVGLKCACTPEMEGFAAAGVKIIFVSEDNINATKAKALETGIISLHEVSNTVVFDGGEVQNYYEEKSLEIVDNIRMMAASRPLDKLYLIRCLKEKGHVVAFTGIHTSDAPALKEADIGLSMRTRCSESAKENSDIVILEDKLSYILDIFKLGRWAYNNIQKNFQLHLTTNVTAITISFVATIASGDSPLNPFQLLWTNLIVDALTILALEAEPWTQITLLPRTQPLITKLMWRNIIFQAFYQFAILMFLHLKGDVIFDMPHQKVMKTLIFNTFVLFQVFNDFNFTMESKKNLFHAIKHKCLVLVKVVITIVIQVVVIEFLNRFISGYERMNWEQWCACIGIALSVWPIGSVTHFLVTHGE